MTLRSVSFSKSHKYKENLCILSHLQPQQEKKSKNFAEKFGSNKKMRTFAIPNDKSSV